MFFFAFLLGFTILGRNIIRGRIRHQDVRKKENSREGVGKDASGQGRIALSTALQNYSAKFLLGEHKTTASGCWPTPNL